MCILQCHRAAGGTVGGRNVGLASGGQLPFDYTGHAFHKVARLFGLLPYLGGRETEIVKNQRGFPAKTGDYGVYHIVERLPGLLCLELGEGKIFAKIFKRNAEVFRLDCGLHEFNVRDRAFRSVPE